MVLLLLYTIELKMKTQTTKTKTENVIKLHSHSVTLVNRFEDGQEDVITEGTTNFYLSHEKVTALEYSRAIKNAIEFGGKSATIEIRYINEKGECAIA